MQMASRCISSAVKTNIGRPITHLLSLQNTFFTGAAQLLVQIRKMVAHLYRLGNIHILRTVIMLYGEFLALREGGVLCYFQDLQHMLSHWLCSKPAYWLIWVISEENVTNLCRKCCNWISASRIMWSSSQECIWKPQLFADSEPTLFLESLLVI